MKEPGKLVKILLAASLAINIVLIAPLIYKGITSLHQPNPAASPTVKKTAPPLPPSGVHDAMHNSHTPPRHDIPPAQRDKIDAIMHAFRLTLINYKQEILAKRIAIIETLGDPDFDAETVFAKTRELNDLENKLNLQFTETLMRVNAELEPEQRLQFLYRLSRNWFFMDRPAASPHSKPRRHP